MSGLIVDLAGLFYTRAITSYILYYGIVEKISSFYINIPVINFYSICTKTTSSWNRSISEEVLFRGPFLQSCKSLVLLSD